MTPWLMPMKTKNNLKLIESLIEKAKLRKGLSHREGSVLLACENEEMNEKIYRLAEQIKKDFYGNRIVYLRRCTFPTTVSTAAPIAPII